MSKVATNQKYAALLGWVPSDFGASTFDEDLVSKITDRQVEFGLAGKDVDGIAGPLTYKAHMISRQAFLLRSMGTPCSNGARLAMAGSIALCEAKLMWLRDIIDGPAGGEASRLAIDKMIRTTEGINWTWEPPYQWDKFEWCGAFVATAWREAGLLMPIRYYFLASTLRVDKLGKYLPMGNAAPNPPPPPPAIRRMIIELDEKSTAEQCVFPDGTSVREGDIVTMGGVNTGPGKHIGIVERVSGRSLITIEGNGQGTGPRGNVRQGVVRATRPIGLPHKSPATTYFIRRVVRLAPGDLA